MATARQQAMNRIRKAANDRHQRTGALQTENMPGLNRTTQPATQTANMQYQNLPDFAPNQSPLAQNQGLVTSSMQGLSQTGNMAEVPRIQDQQGRSPMMQNQGMRYPGPSSVGNMAGVNRTQVQPGRAQMPTGMAYTQDGGLGGGSPEGLRRRAAMQQNRMQQMPNQAMGQAVPQTGLIGSEQAMTTGLQGAMRALGRGADGGGYGGGGGGGVRYKAASQMAVDANPTQGYQQGGEQAQQMNAALTGALGADAQAQAYAQFQESPGQAYLREQAERGLTRNAAAIGGLGGGAVRSALQEQAIGMAAQDFENQFNRRGTVADRGMNAANTEAEILMGQDRNQTSLDQAAMSANASMANASLNAGTQRALAAAGYQFDSGNNFAAGRTNAGNNIANNIAQSSSNLAQYIADQGNNMGNVYGRSGAEQGASFYDYANNAANVRGNASGNYMGVSGIPQNNQNTFGNYGQLLQGIGGGLQAYNQYQQQPQNAAPAPTGSYNTGAWDGTYGGP